MAEEADPHAFIDAVCEERYLYDITVRSVYDGDTLRADIRLGFGVTLENQSMRLFGVDTPEVRGSEAEHGRRVRDLVRARLRLGDPDARCRMFSVRDRTGKYGRYLAVVICPGDEDGDSLNKWLLREGHARRFMA